MRGSQWLTQVVHRVGKKGRQDYQVIEEECSTGELELAHPAALIFSYK